MKLITPLSTVAAAVLCTASLSVAAEPSSPTRPVTPVVVVDESPVLLAASGERPKRARAGVASSWNPGVRGARAAAANGPGALRRYIDRTRMIYALRFEDFAVDR